MRPASLDEWLRYQATLNDQAIELGLDRVREVGARLVLQPPNGAVFSVAGTNGKGSCVALLERLLANSGRRVAVYTSPHLCRYNERVHCAGRDCDDAALLEAFNAVEDARSAVPLTYFEFGTLAALWLFSRMDADAWVLEVGLGGRLDAVNLIDADFALIATVALDHQRWLGDSIEAIAAEKAGIMRAGHYALYGDEPVPDAIRAHALRVGAKLRCAGEDFGFVEHGRTWDWRGAGRTIEGLLRDRFTGTAQMRNASLAMTAIECYRPDLLSAARVDAALAEARPAGRFQIVERTHQWVLDVAHNPQAAKVLRDQVRRLPESTPTTVVLGMLADKQADEFIGMLSDVADCWITCTVDDPRAVAAGDLRAAVMQRSDVPVRIAKTPAAAFACAEQDTAKGGRIVVCGSFHVVGPALQWLGMQPV